MFASPLPGRVCTVRTVTDDRPPLDERLDAMPATARPELTVTEAAKATGVDRRTISRRLDADAFPNAHRDVGRQGQPESGPWLIPVADLIAAGLRPYAPTSAEAEPKATGTTDLRGALADAIRRAEVAESRRELAEHDRDAARAVATERERTIAALNVAVRALEAGPVRTPTEPLSPPSAPPPRRRWWSRGG